MPLNWDLLEQTSEQVAEDVKSGGKKFSYTHIVEDWQFDKEKDGKTPRTAEFRLLPPTENMGGSYFVRITRYKFGKKTLISKEVLGEHCVIGELWDEYKRQAKDDADIKALFDDWKSCSKSILYIVPALFFSDPGGEAGYTPDGDESKIFLMKASTFNDLHQIVVNPKYRVKDKAWGVLSRTHGRNFTISKGGQSLVPDPDVLDFSDVFYEEYYNGSKRKDIWEYIFAMQKSDEHLVSVVKNYFEGAAIVEDDGSTRKHYLGITDDNEPKEEKKKAAPVRKQASPTTAAKASPAAQANGATSNSAFQTKKAAPAKSLNEEDLLTYMENGGEKSEMD